MCIWSRLCRSLGDLDAHWSSDTQWPRRWRALVLVFCGEKCCRLLTGTCLPRLTCGTVSVSRTLGILLLQKNTKVAVMGASGGIGQPMSLLLKMDPRISHLAIYDIVHTHGVAADISHISTHAKVCALYEDVWYKFDCMFLLVQEEWSLLTQVLNQSPVFCGSTVNVQSALSVHTCASSHNQNGDLPSSLNAPSLHVRAQHAGSRGVRDRWLTRAFFVRNGSKVKILKEKKTTCLCPLTTWTLNQLFLRGSRKLKGGIDLVRGGVCWVGDCLCTQLLTSVCGSQFRRWHGMCSQCEQFPKSPKNHVSDLRIVFGNTRISMLSLLYAHVRMFVRIDQFAHKRRSNFQKWETCFARAPAMKSSSYPCEHTHNLHVQIGLAFIVSLIGPAPDFVVLFPHLSRFVTTM